MGRPLIDLTGKRFTRLTVLLRSDNKGVKVVWLCQCDCGKTCLAHGHDLRLGKHRSCGCLHLDSITKHGKASGRSGRSAEYNSWQSMKDRCLNTSATGYEFYGGRGVRVCQRWLESFESFLSDMGSRPSGTSLDRIDVNGNYEPENCRWATRKEQNRNMRSNNWIIINGEKKTITDWAAESGVSVSGIRWRLKLGITGEALLAPARGSK